MSGPTRILITGASGCVGQYTAETLLRRSDGSPLLLQANTLCVHGDNASSVAAVQRIREALKPA